MAKATLSGNSLDAGIRLAMYQQLLRIRLVEEAIASRYQENEMRCPTHLCTGQEAVPVGVSAHLSKNDLVFSGHRSHGHYLAKGGNLKSMLAELYGRATGCAGGKGGSQHLIDLSCGFMGSAPILASTISVGVGAAWAVAMAKENRVVVVYFGDGATEEGTFHEAMNFASVKQLPVVFVCENNLYSVHSPLNVRQPKRPISALGAAHGMASATGDGNNVETVYRIAGEAIDRARASMGPSIIELATYRWMEHCGPNGDIELNYRSAAELADWRTRDPVATYFETLIASDLLTRASDLVLRQRFDQELEEAFSFARASAFPAAGDLMSHIYPAQASSA